MIPEGTKVRNGKLWIEGYAYECTRCNMRVLDDDPRTYESLRNAQRGWMNPNDISHGTHRNRGCSGQFQIVESI